MTAVIVPEEGTVEVFSSVEELQAAVGRELGPTPWVQVEQASVDAFADLTGDHNWIHVDVERAREGSLGGTIAHGYLTLSLVPQFSHRLMALRTPGIRLNYGVEAVRFPHPVLVGSRLRARATVVGVPEVASGHQLRVRYVIEIEGVDKPACVVETIVLLRPA